MAQPRTPRPIDPQDNDREPHDGEGPRGRRNDGASKTVPWLGCSLVPLDETKEHKNVSPDAQIGVKVELIGWGAAGEVSKGKLKRNAPLDVVSDTFTADDLHRLYGHGGYFCQAYTLSATRGLQTPLGSKTWHLLPCEFDEPDDNDPEEEEDDVGTAPWPNMDAFKESEPTLRKEMRRRALIRRELADDEGQGRGRERDRDRFDDVESDDGEGPPRGFRDRDRGMRGRGGPMGGRGSMGHRDDPDWLYEPTHPMVTPMPGMKWAMGGNPMKWQQVPDDGKALTPAAPATIVAAPEKTPFLETQAGVTMIAGALSALGLIVTKAMEKAPLPPPPPDPMAAFATLMAAMNGSKGDPKELKQLEIEAEDKRARLAMEAETARVERETARITAAAEAAEKQRRHDAETAAAQRAHDAKLEAERREAAAAAAIVAEERAKQRAIEARNDLIALERMGLTGHKGPTPEQAAAERQLAVMQAQIEWMRSAPKTPDVMESFEKAKTMLTKLGVKVGDSEDGAGSLVDALSTPAAAAMATAIGPGLNAILMKLSGATEPAAPVQTQVGVALSAEEVARREQIAFETGIRKAREMEAQRMAQLASQAPPQPQMQPQAQPSMLDWQSVAAPPPADQPDPTPEPMAGAPEEHPVAEPEAETAEEPSTDAPAEPVAEEQPAPQEPIAEAPTEPMEEAPPVEAPAEEQPVEEPAQEPAAEADAA